MATRPSGKLDPDDLKLQWRKYNELLEDLIIQKPDMGSMTFIKMMIDPGEELYLGIQGVLSVMVQALVTRGGVESVCESMVSVVGGAHPGRKGHPEPGEARGRGDCCLERGTRRM